MNLYQHTKNQFISFIFSWHTVNLESWEQSGHIHFWPCPPHYFSINFYFSWIYNNMHKIRLFHHLFQRYSWFKNPVIWLTESILDRISVTRFFWKLLTFLNLYQHEKNQLISSLHSWDTADFRVSKSKRPHPFPTNTMQKLLK